MSDIKEITKGTDFTKLNMSKINWDLEFNNKPYDIYSIKSHIHCIGSRCGDNDRWCCPSGEKPCYDNLIAFNGKAPAWGIRYEQNNYYKNKWSGQSIEYRGMAIITRNGKDFYGFGARDMDYGLARAQVVLVQLQEHPIAFHYRDWQEEVINRKIYYCNQPAIIERICNIDKYGICVMIVPDKEHIDKFLKPAYMMSDDSLCEYEDEYAYRVKDDILTDNIYWYRD